MLYHLIVKCAIHEYGTVVSYDGFFLCQLVKFLSGLSHLRSQLPFFLPHCKIKSSKYLAFKLALIFSKIGNRVTKECSIENELKTAYILYCKMFFLMV